MYKWIPRKTSALICMLIMAGGIFLFPAGAAVYADTTSKLTIEVNGEVISFLPNQQGPMLIEGRTYVPLRVIGENLGARVEWKSESRQVLINWLSSQTGLVIPDSASGDVQIIIDGKLLSIPSDLGKAFISKLDRTMIPLRAVGEALGCEVDWDGNNTTVRIKNQTTPGSVSEPESPQPNPVPTENTQPQAPANNPESQLLKDLAQYKTNLKLMDGTVINSEVLLTKDPAAFSSEQLSAFKTYLGQLSVYQPNITLPGGEQINMADLSILGNSYLTADQLRKWMNSETPRLTAKAQANGQQFKAIPDLADLYIKIGAEYGIRGDLAFCQAAKETGYWQFTGSVRPDQNNYCGLYATGNPLTGQESLNGADPGQVCIETGTHGAIFTSPEAGVEAHIQHLYVYATKNPLPAGKVLVDPRFTLVSKGIAPTWLKLNARWAVPGTTYGQSIIYDYWYKAAAAK